MRWKAVSPEEYRKIYLESIRDPFSFWEREARRLKWARVWSRVYEGSPPRAKWFVGGLIDAFYNIIGKHRDTWVWYKPALIYENEAGDARVITYSELDALTHRVASGMKALGVKPGDWVLIYSQPSIEATVAALASVRIGAPFEMVFTGFGYYELAKRIKDTKPRLIFVSGGYTRRGRRVDVLSTARRAIEAARYQGEVVVIEEEGAPALRDNEISFQRLLSMSNAPVEGFVAPSDHPLFGLHVAYQDDYKLIVHGTGGYLVQTYSTSTWIGIRPRDTYFCTVWPGWITGITYVVFGPLMIGATVVLYDGGPDHPTWDRWWRIIEDYAVTIFLTTSGALHILSKRGGDAIRSRNVDTLKAMLVTAEPLYPETWHWAYTIVGTGKTPMIDSIPDRLTGRIPVVNLYIQSELGTFVTGNLINYTFPPIAPGSAGTPIPGFNIAVVSDRGEPVVDSIGKLAVLSPWPAMPISYPLEYEEKWRRGYYETGDYGYATNDGYIYVLGRADNVAKVSGYRLSPGAVEKALAEVFGVKARVLRVSDEDRFESLIIEYEGDVEPDIIRSFIKTSISPIAEPREVIKRSMHTTHR
jgi:acetyl-CoA synthetase